VDAGFRALPCETEEIPGVILLDILNVEKERRLISHLNIKALNLRQNV
jgi:hypothetical protein